MQIDQKTNAPKAYQTKAERIAQLETAIGHALALCAHDPDAARRVLEATQRTDGRWRKPSPLSHAALCQAAGAPQASQSAPGANPAPSPAAATSTARD
jgi:hypothetical protein